MNIQARWVQLIGGLTISVIFLWLALRSMVWDQFFASIREANFWWIGAAIVLQVVAILSRSERWRQILEARVRSGEALLALGVGYLFTNLLPLRAGELARVTTLSAKGRIPIVQVGAATIVERLLDVVCVLLMLTVLLPFVSMPQLVRESAAVFSGGVLVCAVGLVGLVRANKKVEAFLDRMSSRLLPGYSAAIKSRWQELVIGLRGTATSHGKVGGLSILTWVASIAVYWCVLRAFEPFATVVEAGFMVGALALAISVPSAPGFLGVFHLVGQQALVIPFGDKYEPSTAFAIAISAHLVYFVFTSGLGLIAVWRLGGSAIGAGLQAWPPGRSRLTGRLLQGPLGSGPLSDSAPGGPVDTP